MRLSSNDFPTSHFDNKPVKAELESMIYSYVGTKMLSNVLQITGPALERHVINALKIAKTGRCKIHCVELAKNIFKEMESRYKQLPPVVQKRVRLHNCDVANYHLLEEFPLPCRFEDLDLCQTLASTKYLIAHRLKSQSCYINGQYNKLLKCMVITSTLRSQKLTSFLEDLNVVLSVIGAEIKYKEHKTQPLVKKMRMVLPTVIKVGRIEEIGVVTYKDRAPMVSAIITYR